MPDKSKSDFRFLVQNVLLGIFSITLGVLIWAIEHRKSGSANEGIANGVVKNKVALASKGFRNML